MERLIGLDTEYGIYVEGARVTDLVEEARALVASWPGLWAGPWDYSQEQPLRDLRGYSEKNLNTDPQDDRFERPPTHPLTRSEERADRALVNGARLYQDHGHPEYATPECHTLFDLVAHDKAGERVLRRCAQAYAQKTGKSVWIYKNNVDFHGMSYGTHENYLMRRDVAFDDLASTLLPFLVTRILYAGAGKVCVEGVWKKVTRFQLSQRADFFTELCSVDTLHRRPILNTRDEPHMDPARFRRLHVIAGDANLCEVATALKLGTTVLVLDLLESGWRSGLALKRPIQAIKALSKDMEAALELDDGATISGLALQRHYLEAAQSRFAGRDEETDWVLGQWEGVLDGLERGPAGLRDRLDWVAKYELLSEFLEAEGLSWSKVDPEWLQSLDLAYHDIDPDSGLFMGLAEAGQVQRVVDEAAVARALEEGPRDTRAFARGWCVRHLHEKIAAITWSRVVFDHEGEQVVLALDDVADAAAARELNAQVQDPNAVLTALARRTGGLNA